MHISSLIHIIHDSSAFSCQRCGFSFTFPFHSFLGWNNKIAYNLAIFQFYFYKFFSFHVCMFHRSVFIDGTTALEMRIHNYLPLNEFACFSARLTYFIVFFSHSPSPATFSLHNRKCAYRTFSFSHSDPLYISCNELLVDNDFDSLNTEHFAGSNQINNAFEQNQKITFCWIFGCVRAILKYAKKNIENEITKKREMIKCGMVDSKQCSKFSTVLVWLSDRHFFSF